MKWLRTECEPRNCRLSRWAALGKTGWKGHSMGFFTLRGRLEKSNSVFEVREICLHDNGEGPEKRIECTKFSRGE